MGNRVKTCGVLQEMGDSYDITNMIYQRMVGSVPPNVKSRFVWLAVPDADNSLDFPLVFGTANLRYSYMLGLSLRIKRFLERFKSTFQDRFSHLLH